MIFNWAKANINDINEYCVNTYNNFATIDIVPAIKCTNVNCTSIEHRHQIDLFYSQMCDALQRSSSNCIPSSKPSDSHDYIVPRFNEYVKDLHCTARSDYVA